MTAEEAKKMCVGCGEEILSEQGCMSYTKAPGIYSHTKCFPVSAAKAEAILIRAAARLESTHEG